MGTNAVRRKRLSPGRRAEDRDYPERSGAIMTGTEVTCHEENVNQAPRPEEAKDSTAAARS